MAIQALTSDLRIGEWTVEPALNQLSASGRAVKIEPKAMEVLLCLAARAGKVASREELLDEVWRGAVVGDDALTQVIIKLRKALGDAYIETIPKRGYRLIAPVSQTGAPGEAAPAPRKSKLGLVAAAAVLAAATVISVLVWNERGAQPRPDRVEAPASALPTVSVRRFEPVGTDPEAALLARGMTADLISDLSKLSGLAVIDATAAGTEAAAHYLVTGTVQRFEGRVRVNVSLADARSGKQLWSERFDRERASFFAIQEELGPRLLQTLPAKVSEEELRRVARPYTRNLEAYSLFQRGQAALNVRTKPENEAARALLRKAIALDGAFSRAYAALAMTHLADYRNQWTGDVDAALARAMQLARSAQEMSPEFPETHWTVAFVHVHRREFEQAIAHLETALRLAPSYADGLALLGGLQTYYGRPAESVRILRSALRFNPEGSYLYFMLLGRAYFFLGDLEQARIHLENSLGRNPEALETHVYLAALYVATHDDKEAAWKAEEIRALQPGFKVRDWLRTYPMSDPAQVATLERSLARLGL
jgi:DNA-binding winged helix-turn-helix (wHTH) protein/TolB-like protein/Flp pilus assembly protein TadD